MKTLLVLFFILSMGITSNINAQVTLDYNFHSLKECDNDTIKYLNKNYNFPNLRYLDKTLKSFYDDLDKGIQFQSYIMLEYSGVLEILFFLDPIDKITKQLKAGKKVMYVRVMLYWNINYDSEQNAQIRKLGVRKLNKMNKQFMKLTKNIEIEVMEATDVYSRFIKEEILGDRDEGKYPCLKFKKNLFNRLKSGDYIQVTGFLTPKISFNV